MPVFTAKISVTSSDSVPEIIDITERVKRCISKSKIKEGQVLVYSQHTTAAVFIQENEKNLHKDIKEALCRLCPPGAGYHHSNSPDHIIDKRGNAHAHLQQCLLGGPSETIPLINGEVALGTYQKIFLVELDRKRTRNIIIQVVGA